ncbi:bifunctional lytic transglycosylase/C40 family peptidase [Alkalihalobacillus sp. TS-13]|uniref:C40 family peptidase n=1 Tax=Alkalihalobacillus sp. TS-13 TaxID=2842455 RepID=UPI001C871C41|nr:bifunctional lytic transglycosylase/C40 family peptidase [Alkalihalobacillus sp. TS-13]
MSHINEHEKARTGRLSAAKPIMKKVTKAGATKGAIAMGWSVFLAIVVVLILGIIVVTMFFMIFSGDDGGSEQRHWGGDISSLGKNEIPSKFIKVYKAAEKKYGVPWNLLAAHHRVETHFSTITPMISPVGAEGHMQFMPCTWVGWGHSTCDGLGKGNIPESEKTKPKVIERYGGFGVDGNGDGKADPWNIKDAIFAAAKILKANGAADGQLREAVFAYNHDDRYVSEVLGFADRYVQGYVEVGGAGDYSGVEVVDVGRKWIKNSTYVWGGGRNQADIKAGRFDCSSFVHWAFKQVDVNLGMLGMTTTFTLKELGKPVPPNKMKPGDLVFFDTNGIDGHVGIYAGDGKFIGAQSSTGVAFADMSTGYWKNHFNGRVRRIE